MLLLYYFGFFSKLKHNFNEWQKLASIMCRIKPYVQFSFLINCLGSKSFKLSTSESTSFGGAGLSFGVSSSEFQISHLVVGKNL